MPNPGCRSWALARGVHHIVVHVTVIAPDAHLGAAGEIPVVLRRQGVAVLRCVRESLAFVDRDPRNQLLVLGIQETDRGADVPTVGRPPDEIRIQTRGLAVTARNSDGRGDYGPCDRIDPVEEFRRFPDP